MECFSVSSIFKVAIFLVDIINVFDISCSGGGFGDLSDMGAGDALTLGLGQSEYDRRKKKK